MMTTTRLTRTLTLAAATLAGAALAVSPAGAQVWDAPQLVIPGAAPGLALHLIDHDPGDLGLMGTWQTGTSGAAGMTAQFRGGVVDGPGDASILAGITLDGVLLRESADGAPLTLLWFTGGGLTINDDFSVISAPLGLSFGAEFGTEAVTFRPYVAPKMVLDIFIGDAFDDDIELDAGVEIGSEFAFSRGWAIRAAASVADREAVSIGVLLPLGS